MIASLEQSLKRLQLDYVDIYYSHRPDPKTPIEETIGALDQAVRSGKALYVGVSSYSPEETMKAVKIANELGTPITIHQPYYNMMSRFIENGLMQTCKKHGLGMIVFCPLAQGLLTPRYLDGIPEGSRASKDYSFLKKDQITPKLVQKLQKLNQIAKSRGQTLAQLALSWAGRDKLITSVLIGASRVSQIEDNLKILQAPEFSSEELDKIDVILKDD